MNRHRDYRPPESVTVSMEAAGRIFGKSREALKKLTRRELSRLYRRRAQELRPGQGRGPRGVFASDGGLSQASAGEEVRVSHCKISGRIRWAGRGIGA